MMANLTTPTRVYAERGHCLLLADPRSGTPFFRSGSRQDRDQARAIFGTESVVPVLAVSRSTRPGFFD